MREDAKQTGSYIWRQINRMQHTPNESALKADLANLRRGIARAPGSMPEIWQITLEGLPDSLMSRDGQPTKAEWSVHTALTLFALHQQGKDIKINCMHQEDCNLGTAVGKLVKGDDDLPRIKRRFDAAATADSPSEFAHHLRGLISLMRAESIPLDYLALGRNLYFYQFPDARDGVRLRWGQDFYRQIYRSAKQNINNENEKEGNPNE